MEVVRKGLQDTNDNLVCGGNCCQNGGFCCQSGSGHDTQTTEQTTQQ